jgi:hypothetical protein
VQYPGFDDARMRDNSLDNQLELPLLTSNPDQQEKLAAEVNLKAGKQCTKKVISGLPDFYYSTLLAKRAILSLDRHIKSYGDANEALSTRRIEVFK